MNSGLESKTSNLFLIEKPLRKKERIQEDKRHAYKNNSSKGAKQVQA